MTNTPTHYFNFKPCEAVQYTEINRFEVTRVANYYSYGVIGDELVLTRKAAPNIFIRPGQWLIRQDDKVWVQDDEPARFERWLFGSPTEGFQWVEGVGLTGTLTHRRPVVTVGDQEWLGPWEAVDE